MQNLFMQSRNIRAAVIGLGALLSLLWTTVQAAPPYDVTITFTPPASGPVPDGYSLYVDDCAATGPVGAAVGTATSGQTFPGLIVADGTYQICMRTFNATGENPDPGPVATAIINDVPVPGPIGNFDVQVTCPLSNCTINVTIN